MNTPNTRHMIPTEGVRFDALVESIAEALDVPDGAYQQATERYESVGRWLAAEGSPLHDSRPVIYPQGSFALGTVIRPLRSEGAEYDIDAVVELEGPIRDWTPSELKRLVGDRLRAHSEYNRMLGDEGRRCWTLEYAAATGAPGFHMDLLPSIRASAEERLGQPSVAASTTAIAITNRTRSSSYEWRTSDPKGYAAWFRRRMQVRFDSNGVPLSERRARIEAVPANEVRTPLQQAVRILKRHRDVMFVHDRERAPISVILTTLAAHAYGGEASVGDAFLGIVQRMEQHVERRGGRVYVSNPVRPEENFADRWEGDARKEVAFELWLDEVKGLGARLRGQSDQKVEGELVAMLGESVARESVRKFAQRMDGRPPTLLAERRTSPAPPSPPEFSVLAAVHAAHRQTLPWQDHSDRYRVRVRGSVIGGQGARRGPIESARTRLLPHARLEFRVETNAPSDAQYFWQVVNTGTDAERARGLRGDFEPGTAIRSESTLYRGMHSIECFVVHRGECVGRSGQFFVRIGA